MVNSSAEQTNFALPPQALIEFKQIYKEEFGIELSDEEATQKAVVLINIFKVFSKKRVAVEREKA